MVKKEIVDQVRELLFQPNNIRNISVIAHVDHGKSTLTDSLISAAGLLSKEKAGKERVMDCGDEEKERGITIKSTSISLPFKRLKNLHPNFDPNWPDPPPPRQEAEEKSEEKSEEQSEEQLEESFLINLIDSPGHVDFSSEVSAALRVTDGALVVVDCVEGVRVQTRTVLRQALAERIKPVLFMNKIDRIFSELRMDEEEAYQTLSKAIESVNVVIATYKDDLLGDVTVYPQAGTVGFGSGLQGWGFTLYDFAVMWHDKFNMNIKKLMKKMWGDHFWDPKLKKFVTEPLSASGQKLERGFNLLVLKPLRTLFSSIREANVSAYTNAVNKLKLQLPSSWTELPPKEMLELVMRNWLPAGPALLRLIADHLPSPVTAQKYRVANLYSGPQDDEAAQAIRACDSQGELMIYVSKMVPTSDYSRFFAFGRIFSGTATAGTLVRIQGPNYMPECKDLDLYEKRVTGMVLMMGGSTVGLSAMPAGTLVGLVGIDQYLVKNGTITTMRNAYNFVSMKYSVAPVVRVAVAAENPAHLQKLTQGLRKMAKSDPLVQVYNSPTGEHIVAGCGELHLEICLNELRKQFMHDCPIKVSDPVVAFCESISKPSEQVCISKSPNKLNRLFMTARPLDERICLAAEDHKFSLDCRDQDGIRARARLLQDEYGWDNTSADARKIWCFGAAPEGQGNVLVDCTKGVAYLHEIRDTVISEFLRCTNNGVLASEPMRGVIFQLEDAKVHQDPPHRGSGQLMPATRAAVYACQLASGPCLLEPFYSCDVTVPQDALDGVYRTLRKRRAVIIGTEDADAFGSPQRVVKGYLPVLESFGFTAELRKHTGGQAFPQLMFSHWDKLEGDLTDPSTLAARVLAQVRARKGLPPAMPLLADYHTKL